MADNSINNYMFKFIEDICNEIGPRESGTEQELQAGDKIESEMKKFCHETLQEEYISSPHAFLGGIRYGAAIVFVAIILYWLNVLIDLNILALSESIGFILLTISLILIVVTVSYFILEVMKYYEVYDFLFPKRKSRNIIGTINPKGEVKHTIIFSAHHDSAFEFNTFYYLKRIGQIIINIGYLAVAIVLVVVILKMIFYLSSINIPLLFFGFGILFLCFIPIVLVYILFHSYKPVLGAFDNLSGVSVVLGIGKQLSDNKKENKFFPENTRVILVSFAGEEAGLRGSKRYIKKHLEELKKTKTIIVNMDGIAKKDNTIIFNKESGIGVKHELEVYNSILEISERLNYNPTLMSLPFGATDAAAFSRKKIPAVSIGGLNLNDELPYYYHTRNDTPDVVEKEALGQILDICLEYLRKIDQ